MQTPSHKIEKIADLDELQEWMCKSIRTPMSQQETIAPDPVYYLTANSELSARERLNIYADDYWSRCINSLSEDFPGLEYVWGHEKFHRIAEQYLVQHSSSSYSLRNLGKNLPDYVRAEYHEADRELALDMLRFHWAKIEAFDNAALPPFDPAKLDAGQRQHLASLAFAFQPHVTLLRLGYPVFQVVEQLQSRRDKANIATPGPQESFVVVYRHDFTVYHKEVDRPFYLLLERMRGRASLADAYEAIHPMLNKDEIKKLEKKAQAWFQQCVALQWLCEPVITGSSGQ